MDLETLNHIEKIASKLKIADRKKRLATAKEINELAKLIIDWKKVQNEESNTIH